MSTTTKTVATVSNVFASRELKTIDNDASRKAKNAVKGFFDNYDKQLSILWQGLKAEDQAFQALNNVIAGIAGGDGDKPAVWLVKHYSKYVTKDLQPCNRRKNPDTGEVYYTAASLVGQYARGILKKAALNCIESQRLGNRFEQKTVTPIAK